MVIDECKLMQHRMVYLGISYTWRYQKKSFLFGIVYICDDDSCDCDSVLFGQMAAFWNTQNNICPMYAIKKKKIFA